ncbi:TrlF family AAA-like ATPase [Flavobacterium sp.]|uniref:TrlF family AAA-like ATPase n=1 Tax=Flavobacterium sp. TaxID=239 RepID=UPI00120A60C9|nr:AAA family ATPase [Flavobacterium sp.]RZJ71538.1 MAG: hypothetical protein EOO49_09265 [Flavobacterium sp.]
MSQIYRGSEWRKWDLHFHTPSSYDYQNLSVTNEAIVDGLFANGIAVVAITDHNIIDVSRIRELKRLGAVRGITVLPGIEFLAEARGSDPIHYIGIFSEDCDLDLLWGQLEHKTELFRIKTGEKKFNEVYCVLQDTVNLIKELGGLVTIHAGSKSNTVENITNSLPHTIAQKIEIAMAVDFYELGKPQDKTGYINTVFPAIGKHIPMIIASDNHNITKYILKENCWIKADPTFEGLKQVVFEPKERVRIQAGKPQEKFGYQVIDHVIISHRDFSGAKIYLNQNLNSIIGGRSTGKSILLGAIAKKLHCGKEVKFENREYEEYVEQIVSEMTIIWRDGIEDDQRNIEYFPQSYMHRLARNSDKELDNLVEEIITQDEHKANLLKNYADFSRNNSSEIMAKISMLFQTLSDYHGNLRSVREIGDQAGILKERLSLSTQIEALRSTLQISAEELTEYNTLVNKFNYNTNQISFAQTEILKLSNLERRSITNDSIEFEFNDYRDVLKSQIQSIFNNLKDSYQKEWSKNIGLLKLGKTHQIEELQTQNNEILSNPLYTKGASVVRNNEQFQDLQLKLKVQTDKLFEIENLKKSETAITAQYHEIKSSIISLFRDYYNNIVSFLDSLSLQSEKLTIKAEVKLDLNQYRSILLASVNQQSSQGQEISGKPIDSVDEFFTAVNELFNSLLNNSVTLKGGYTPLILSQKLLSTNFFSISYEIVYEDVFKHMSEGKKAFVVLMLLLDFSNKSCPILIDQPEDDLDNRAIYHELVKYIIKKKKQRQVIVVTHNPNIVVGADSELVIVSNQNGINTPNTKNRKFEYVSGSLEHTKLKNQNVFEILYSQGTRQHVCEILEGGFEAFKRRELKYRMNT